MRPTPVCYERGQYTQVAAVLGSKTCMHNNKRSEAHMLWRARNAITHNLDLDSFIKRAKRASSGWCSGRYCALELPKPCKLRGRI